jgi:hypothetical protein
MRRRGRLDDVFCVRGMILSLEAAIDIEKERKKMRRVGW